VIRTVRVGSAAGLHARAAAVVAAAAGAEAIAITVRRHGGPAVPADSVLALLSLAAVRGTELTLEADDSAPAGPALARIAALLAAHVDGGAADAGAADAGSAAAGAAGVWRAVRG